MLDRYNYHTTNISRLQSILEKGLIPQIGVNSDLVNDKVLKLSMSRGMEGVIGMTMCLQRRWDYENEQAGESKKDLDDILGESVYLRFNRDEPMKEKEDIMDSFTTEPVLSEALEVCLIENQEDGTVSYNRDDVVTYMMAQIGVEEVIEQLPKSDREFMPGMGKTLIDLVREYYETKREEIDKFKLGKYSLKALDLETFIEVHGKDILGKGKNRQSELFKNALKSRTVGSAEVRGVDRETVEREQEIKEREVSLDD